MACHNIANNIAVFTPSFLGSVQTSIFSYDTFQELDVTLVSLFEGCFYVQTVFRTREITDEPWMLICKKSAILLVKYCKNL